MNGTRVKPPLGLKPRYISKAQRMCGIKDAVQRYMGAWMPIPDEWITEYNELAAQKEVR